MEHQYPAAAGCQEGVQGRAGGHPLGDLAIPQLMNRRALSH